MHRRLYLALAVLILSTLSKRMSQWIPEQVGDDGREWGNRSNPTELITLWIAGRLTKTPQSWRANRIMK